MSELKRLMATTEGTPNFETLVMWRTMFAQPASTSATFSVVYSCGRGVPGVTCSRRARKLINLLPFAIN